MLVNTRNERGVLLLNIQIVILICSLCLSLLAATALSFVFLAFMSFLFSSIILWNDDNFIPLICSFRIFVIDKGGYSIV